MVMIFSNEKARRQLLEKGIVFTFRKKPHKLGKDWATDSYGGKKICDIDVVWRAKVCPLELDNLDLFTRNSGFETLNAWIQAIGEFGINPCDYGYLHEVRKVNSRKEEKNERKTTI